MLTLLNYEKHHYNNNNAAYLVLSPEWLPELRHHLQAGVLLHKSTRNPLFQVIQPHICRVGLQALAAGEGPHPTQHILLMLILDLG
jgi:hypothetical protein